jgi:hypothetical protein
VFGPNRNEKESVQKKKTVGNRHDTVTEEVKREQENREKRKARMKKKEK